MKALWKYTSIISKDWIFQRPNKEQKSLILSWSESWSCIKTQMNFPQRKLFIEKGCVLSFLPYSSYQINQWSSSAEGKIKLKVKIRDKYTQCFNPDFCLVFGLIFSRVICPVLVVNEVFQIREICKKLKLISFFFILTNFMFWETS